MSHERTEAETEGFLAFSVDNQRFATPLLGVREVMEFQAPKPVPSANPHFLGVINVRGEIVSVLALRGMLRGPGAGQGEQERPFLVVFETADGLVAGGVDSIDFVCRLAPKEIDQAALVQLPFSRQHFLGIARYKNTLLTLVDARSLLAEATGATP